MSRGLRADHMATAQTYECPICFATLKLKHPPNPESKLHCPECASVFLPVEDTVADYPSLSGEHTASGSKEPDWADHRSQTAESAPTSWLMTVLFGGLVYVLMAGVVLFLFRDQLFPQGFGPEVDLAYCQLSDQATTIAFHPAEFLNASALPAAVRQNPTLTEASLALKQLLGVELQEVEVVEYHIELATLGAPPGGVSTLLLPQPSLIVVKTHKVLERPKLSPKLIEGIRCYAVHQEWLESDVQLLPLDTMFFANPNTAILGSQATIREILQNWKAQAPRQARRPVAQSATVCFLLHERPMRALLAQVSRLVTPNPLLARGKAGAEWQQITQDLADHSSNLTVSAHLSSEVSWSATFHGKDSAAVQPLHEALENLRQKGLEQLESLSRLATLLPLEAQGQLTLAKEILSAPTQVADDRVSLTFALPAESEAQALQALVKLLVPLGTFRLGP